MSFCHKTSIKLFLVINVPVYYQVHCFKICFSYVLPAPMESSETDEINMSLLGEIAKNCGVIQDDDIS